MRSKPRSNPWLTIWREPKQTLTDIVSSNPSYGFYAISFIYGFLLLIQVAQQLFLQEVVSVPLILGLAPLIGFIVGYLGISFVALLLKWTGTWIRGSATYSEVRAATAWSNLPIILGMLLGIVSLFFLQTPVLDVPTGQAIPEGSYIISPGGENWLAFVGIVQFGLSIWSMIILIKGLKVVQNFSTFKAIMNFILATICILAAAFIMSLFT